MAFKTGDIVKTNDGRTGIVKIVGRTTARVWIQGAPIFNQEQDIQLTNLTVINGSSDAPSQD